MNRPTRPSSRGFQCIPAANGGWIIHANTEDYMIPETIGAFSTTDDMLRFLSDWLDEPMKPEAP